MGLIIALSNIFGAIFDFLLAKFITNTSYRRLFLVVYALCFIYPLLIWSSKTLPLFIFSMAVWGLYGDLSSYATFDFVSRRSRPKEHCKSFGVIGIFRSLGYLMAPIVVGIITLEAVTFMPYSVAILAVFMALFFYVWLVSLSPKKDSHLYDHKAKYRHFNFFAEYKILQKVAKVLLPVLFFNVSLNIFDSMFWTIGPIFSESFIGFKNFGWLFMSAYTLPVLVINWFINPIVLKFGKKKTAFVSFFIGGLILLPICLVTNPVAIIILVFISSLANSIAWPALAGAYADYISESRSYQKEIESLTDFTYNIGFIIGPILGGVLADLVGIKNTFSVLATYSMIIVIILLMVTPKHINVVLHRK